MFQTNHSSNSAVSKTFPISKSSSTQLPRVTARLHAHGVTKSDVTHTTNLPSPSSLSNHQLLLLCKQYGTQAKLWKQKFLGLLPEVDKRKLYLTQGCSSLFEFAAKVGGVSREQVLRVFQLHKRFAGTPDLQTALVSGQISVHKLARLASIATPENQGFLLHQSKLLSQPALETVVRDMKTVRPHSQNPNKIEKILQFDQLQLSVQMRRRLLQLQNKGINLEELLGEFLDQREEKIQHQKQRVVEELRANEDQKTKMNGSTAQSKKQDNITSTRYIPQKIKAVLKQEYGEKCAEETCTNRATNIHHTRRFSLNPSHNPLFLAPLCHQHHEIAHAVDVRAQEYRRR